MKPTILCACGCGKSRPLYDRDGNPRRFVHGHWIKLAMANDKKAKR